MMSPQEIRTVTFDKVMRGYRVEDVDAFLQQVAQEMERLSSELSKKEKKLYILAEKVEEYRKDEDNLKTALLNAQRMGENVIREAKQKADALIREAGIRADTLTRVANEQVEEQQAEMARIRAEVADFKNQVLGMYKAHIELLSDLPDMEEEVEESSSEEVVEVSAEHENAEESVEPVEEPNYESVVTTEVAEGPLVDEAPTEQFQFPDLSSLYGSAENESTSVADEQPKAAVQVDSEQTAETAEQTSTLNAFQGFKGIKFSD